MLQFLWVASRGYRLQPWNSPYLKWRIETYSGIPANTVTRSVFFQFLWQERRSLMQYLGWVGRMRRLLKN